MITYTPAQLAPQSTGTFNRYSSHRAPGTNRPDLFDVEALVNPAAVSAVSESFARSNTAHEGWAGGQDQGRVDGRRAWRHDELGDLEVFKDRRAPSATKVRLIVLVDASGSMRAGMEVNGLGLVNRAEAAGIFAATLVKGLAPLPTVRMEVIQHSFKHGGGRYTSTAAAITTLRRAWEPGTPVAYMNGMPNWSDGGGNADGHALVAIAQHLKATMLPDELPMIISISDGKPADIGRNPTGHFSYGSSAAGDALRDAVKMLRADGITVLSVAIAGGDQVRYYGKDAVVRFNGDWVKLGTDIATLIGKVVGTSYQNMDERYGDW